MTKDPIPPSIRGKDSAYPPPPGLDDVMEEALAKNQNIRTKTVGALADNVGHAYGLEGNHRQWAITPQSELGQRIQEARPRMMQRSAPLATEADPFATPAPMGGYAPQQQQHHYGARNPAAAAAMDQAFAATRMAAYDDPGDVAMGVPSRPSWLVPVLVGVAALFVGGALALLVMLAR